MKDAGSEYVIDLLAVGAGPAALVALREAQIMGLRAIAIDKGPVCGALLKHPTYMRWFSTFDKFEHSFFPGSIYHKHYFYRRLRQFLRHLRRDFNNGYKVRKKNDSHTGRFLHCF